MTVLAAVFAALIGLSLGLLGGGGSILTVPVFVYLLGFEPKEAIAATLAVVGVTSLFGAAGHWRAGNVNPRLAATFGVVAMGGTYLGARLAHHLSGAVQLTLFGVVMLAAAYFMSRPRPAEPARAATGDALHRMPLAKVAAVGIGVGVLTGLVGVGGGFMIVPALVLLGKVPMRQAVGTSLLVIAMNSAAGFAGYWGRVEVRWGFLALFTAVAIAGILAGTRLSRRVPQHALRRAFAVLLVIVACFILYQNRGVFHPSAPAAQAGDGRSRGVAAVSPRLPAVPQLTPAQRQGAAPASGRENPGNDARDGGTSGSPYARPGSVPLTRSACRPARLGRCPAGWRTSSRLHAERHRVGTHGDIDAPGLPA